MKTKFIECLVVKRVSAIAAMLVMGVSATATAGAPAGQFEANQPIKLVVPFAPGGGADILARVTAAAVGDGFGQPIVVINKAGAEGAIGSEFVGRSDPDGYTLEMASADTHSIYPHVYKQARFQAGDFTPVTPVAVMGYVLVGRPGLEAENLKELVALSKQRQLSYSSWGVGNSSNLAMLAYIQAADVKPYLHVPYQGAGPAAMALIAGQVDVMMMPVPLARAHAEKIKLYGVLSEQRMKQLPDVHTLREQGIDLVSEAWIGIIAPPKLPPSIADALSKTFLAGLRKPSTVKAIEDVGMRPLYLNATEFAQYFKDESDNWSAIVEAADIKLD